MLKLFRDTGLRFLWISAIAFILDQWSKYTVIDSMSLYQSIQVLPFFNFTYVHNYGAAFSFLENAGGWQRWFFPAIADVVSVVRVGDYESHKARLEDEKSAIEARIAGLTSMISDINAL